MHTPILGQLVLAPERHTNDSHAILINEIADLRKACAEMRALLGVYLNRAQSMLSCDSRSHDRGEIAALEHALSSDCGKDYVHRSELAAAQKEIARLEQLLSGKTISPASGPTSNSANIPPVETQ